VSTLFSLREPRDGSPLGSLDVSPLGSLDVSPLGSLDVSPLGSLREDSRMTTKLKIVEKKKRAERAPLIYQMAFDRPKV
jgi:hypothetical protein